MGRTTSNNVGSGEKFGTTTQMKEISYFNVKP